MRFRILDAGRPEDHAAWLGLWGRWPDREVMAHPEYVALFARPGDRVVAAAWEGTAAPVLFPLVLRPLAAEAWAAPGEERWDATTPYGYGGPFTWGEACDAPAFWRAYEAWCKEARVVCTFARLSLFPDQLAAIGGRVEVRGPNVVVPLAGGPDAVVRQYHRDMRRRLRVAARAGVTVEIDREGARLADFHAVYAHTMERRAAEPWYHLPLGFFARLVSALRGKFAFVHAVAGGRVISSELALVSARNVYSFLGGTREEAFPLHPNETVRHATAQWAVAEGKERLVLGGGRAPDDGILRHKRLLASAGDVPFRTACLMHDEVAYHELVRRRAATHPAWKPRPGFVPMYRG